jgi:hypothetical protein
MPSLALGARSFVLIGHIGAVSAECMYVLPLTNDGAAGFAPLSLEIQGEHARVRALSLSLSLFLSRPSGLRFWRNEFTVTWTTGNCNPSWRSLLALFRLPSLAGVAREKSENWRGSPSAISVLPPRMARNRIVGAVIRDRRLLADAESIPGY